MNDTTKGSSFEKIIISVIAFGGGLATALIGAGVIFPPNDWGPELRKSATASVSATIPATDYDREVSISGKFVGRATADDSRMSVHIKADGELCNDGNPIYKNPYTSPDLEGEDFCLLAIPEGKSLEIIVGSGPQHRVDSKLATMTIRLRKSKRGLF